MAEEKVDLKEQGKVSSRTECSAVSWYKASITGQILVWPCSTSSQHMLVEEYMHGPMPGKKLEKNAAHPLAQGPPFSDAEAQIPLSMGEEL